MILSTSIKPNEKIYYLDTSTGSIGELTVSYIKIINFKQDIEIQYRNIHHAIDVNICTEKEISERIPRNGVLYFKNKYVRDAYREKVIMELKK